MTDELVIPQLTLKKQLYAEARLRGCNTHEAMREIGDKSEVPNPTGYEDDLAVQLYVRRRMAEHKIDSDRVMDVLARQLDVNPSLFVNDDGTINIEQMRAHGHQVRDYSYSRSTNGTVRASVKCYDAQKTAKILANVLGMEQAPGQNLKELEHLYGIAKKYATDTGVSIQQAAADLQADIPKMVKLTETVISELEH